MNPTNRLRGSAAALLLTLALGLALLGGLSAPSAAAVGEPQPGTVTQTAFQTLLESAALTGTGSTTSAVVNVTAWYAADVFVSADISGTGVVTVTPQFGLNNGFWTDAEFSYPAFTLTNAPDTVSASASVTATSSVTSTGYTTTTTVITVTNTVTQTAEFDVTGETAIASTPQRIVLPADGSDLLRLTMAGNALRVKVEWSGTLTPTVAVMLRNN